MYRIGSRTILEQITLRGVVQGVGFRPFVYKLAERFGLHGWVMNHSGGVDIEAEGPPEAVEAFIHALRAEAPPLARVESLETRRAPVHGYEGFEIRPSERQEGRYQLISPDIATCPDCLHELLDPGDRRFRYPFTNCTNCGPRFTIIADIPYDRPNTTMRVFPMCPDCQREYDDPRDRRFHAQPNACPVCGPQLELVPGLRPLRSVRAPRPDRADPVAVELDALSDAAHLLCDGAILAIKGLGGFQLACDATDARAVGALRARKRRPDKPFAVMLAGLDDVREHCQASPEEVALLTSPQCPIVLLPWRASSTIVPEVAPHYRYLGVMLPYTPLHHILLRDTGRPLVMTSGNLTEEPIAAENDEAARRLGHLADAFLLHNRDIHARYDDSVWFVPQIPWEGPEPGPEKGQVALPQPIRRARGYAPFPVRLPFQTRPTLACGAEIKNTFCITRDEYGFVSQHIGDMENLETLEHFQRTIELYKHLFRIDPEVVAHDLHPGYMATRYALEQCERQGLTPVAVQHHHAHLAACLADNGWAAEAGPVIGVSLDGTGYGIDGHIWGGEWLVGDYRSFERAAHLEYLPLPGGDAATRSPWRTAFSYLHTLLGEAPDFVVPGEVDRATTALLRGQIERRLNCPLTSSMGRLFDAVSALLGVCAQASYEAQAAIELEMAARTWTSDRPQSEGDRYPFRIETEEDGYVIRLGELLAALAHDAGAGLPKAEIAWGFHQAIARMTVEACERIASSTGIRTAALSGGCFQNRLLLSLTVPRLRAAGFQVLLHRQVPCNDGGLSLGQAVIAHCQSTERNTS